MFFLALRPPGGILPGGGWPLFPGALACGCVSCLRWRVLRWPAGVCVCAYGSQPAVCADRFHRGRVPGLFRDRIGGTVPAAWWSWCRVDRRAGLLPVLSAWCGRSCGRVCAYSPGGVPGGIMAGPLGLPPVVVLLWDALENHGNFTEKSPGKTPTKKFFKNFPPMGERSAHEKFLQKGVDKFTHE